MRERATYLIGTFLLSSVVVSPLADAPWKALLSAVCLTGLFATAEWR